MNIYIQVAYSYIHVPECSTICIQLQWLCIVTNARIMTGRSDNEGEDKGINIRALLWAKAVLFMSSRRRRVDGKEDVDPLRNMVFLWRRTRRYTSHETRWAQTKVPEHYWSENGRDDKRWSRRYVICTYPIACLPYDVPWLVSPLWDLNQSRTNQTLL